MSIRRRLAAVLCALCPLVVGCADAEPAGDEDVREASLADKNGSTGNNGMGWIDYEDAQVDLIRVAAGGPLVAQGTLEVSADVENGLLATSSGQKIFHYVVACAVPAGVVVLSSLGKMEGLGHMATTEAWLDRGLEPDELGDLLECMIAHINPYGLEVPILLSGPHVRDDGLNHDDYWVDEALWTARVTSVGRAEYVVYPLKPVTMACGPDPLQALMKRLCGQNPDECSFGMGDVDACDEAEEGFKCDGLSAVMTSLTTDGFETMWPSCFN